MVKVRMVGRDQRAVTQEQAHQGRPVTAARPRAAVTLYVALTLLAAAACSLAAYSMHHEVEIGGLIAFIALSTVTDLREVRLPVIGHVTLSFVPVLAALIVFGLWPAILVATASGLATVTVTRDPKKVVFNVGDYVVSTFVAGLFYLAFVPASPAFVQTVLPAFAATGADFLVNTVVLAGVIALSSGGRPWSIWHENYQWGLPSYMTGATLSLLLAWLYLWLGLPGLVLGVPPLFLIWYSYDVYAGRMRDRATHSSEVASFRDELAAAVRSQDELRAVQRRVAGEIERARSIQADLLPRHAPEVRGLELAHRIEFMTEMGGDYFDFVPLADGRLGLVCGDVMGKGLSAALIMTMARSLILSAARDGRSPGEVLCEVNESLTRDLAGQSAPSFLTLAYAIYSPDERALVVANGGHNPLLVFGPGGPRELPSRGSMLGVRSDLEFPEDRVILEPGDTFALFTDGLTEARNDTRELFGSQRLVAALHGAEGSPAVTALAAAWQAVDDFRDGAPPTDDATLLLGRVLPIEDR
jgi:serine phosphatase RsbU (regulator of sigma subunit)